MMITIARMPSRPHGDDSDYESLLQLYSDKERRGWCNARADYWVDCGQVYHTTTIS